MTGTERRKLQIEFTQRIDRIITTTFDRRIRIRSAGFDLVIDHGDDTYRSVILLGNGLHESIFVAHNAAVPEGWHWNMLIIRDHALPMLRQHMVLDELAAI